MVQGVRRVPEDFKPSLLQSLEKGLKTEIDFSNGAVVKYGEKYGIPTPVNKTLVAGIKGIEYRMRHYAIKAKPPGVAFSSGHFL